MGLGLQWAGANDAMAQSVRQRIMDQIAAEQRAKADTQQQVENAFREKQFQSSEELKKAQLQALIENRGLDRADREAKLAGDVAERIPAGTDLPINAPVVGQLRTAGYGGLLTDKPDMVPAPPDALAADPTAGPSALPGTIANAPSPIAGRLVIKGATQKQNESAQKQNEAKIADQRKADELVARGSDLDAKMAHLTEMTQVAWERLRQEGDNATNRAALAKSSAELAQAKLEASVQHNQDMASKTPQPQFFVDTNGATHAVIFDKGEFKEIPLPKGYTPTKAQAPGLFDKLRGLFSSGDTTPTAPAPITDPNWGKK